MNAHNEQQSIIAGALFDLMGYLTCREKKLHLSASDDAAPAVEALTEWAERRGFDLDEARVTDWQAALAAQPSPVVKQNLTTQPAAAQEVVAWRDDAGNLYPDKESVDKYLPRGRTAHALYAAPVTASPADHLHAHLLHMLGAKDHEDAGRIIGQLHAATMRTPGAPGIDIEHFHRAVQRICIKFDGDLPYISGIAEVLDLIDASPKGDDVPHRDLVPGVMRCAKCAFQLHRTNLYLGSGTTGPGDSKTEPCPNGCGPLWPVTWQTWATEGWQQAERYFEELRQLQDSPKGGSDPWRGLYAPERAPNRDEYGCFYHPDIPSWDDEREESIAPLLKAQGFDLQCVPGDFSDEAMEEGGERYWQEMREWNPEPEGDGWRLVAIYDTEDGPYSMFVKPLAQAGDAEVQP